MNPACPTCGKPVDPLRAPSVGVRDGKIVGYCSAECAAAMASRPTRVAPSSVSSGTPEVAPVVPESGPVIEVIHEPASGVVRTTVVVDDAERTPAPRQGKRGPRGEQRRKPGPAQAVPERITEAEISAAIDAVTTPAARSPAVPAPRSEPAAVPHADGPASVAVRTRALIVALVALVVLGGGGLFAYRMWYAPRHGSEGSRTEQAQPPLPSAGAPTSR